MDSKNVINNSSGDIVIYQTEDGLTKIDVNIHDETVWLSLDLMAELYQRDKSTISRHIKNIFNEGELKRDSVVAKIATTAANGTWCPRYRLWKKPISTPSRQQQKK